MSIGLSIPEVAEYLGVSRAQAYRLLKVEGLPYVRLSARRIVVRQADLEEWVEDRVVKESAG